VDRDTFDAVARRTATATGRRDFAKVLGALALGGVGILGATRAASAQVDPADDRRQCIERCLNHAPKKRRARDRCRRRCENR
jgi:hypothetical protein